MSDLKAFDSAVSSEPADRLLSIGVFARRSRLSMKALRLYDRLGVLVPAHVDRSSGYRRYRESQLETARLIAMLRRLDMPLTQVAEVVSVSGSRGAELLRSYWEAAERRHAGQRELVTHLRIKLSGGGGSFDAFEVREREVPEQLVLAEQRHVRVDELATWIDAAIWRLMKVAHELGAQVGDRFVVYYGEVSEDSDGPVEICVPVGLPLGVSTDRAMRSEPAHREAYVRLRKAQVEFPQILSAFDAVEQWIGSHGRAFDGSPREVYFTDFCSAGPADEVCDVAYPIRYPARKEDHT